MAVYLVHLLSGGYGHARHYSGYTTNPDPARRLGHHAAGSGAHLLNVARRAGVGWTLTRVWPGWDRAAERRLKDRGSAARVCPLCVARDRRCPLGPAAYLTPAPEGRRCRTAGCGQPADYCRPWGTYQAGLCLLHAARYAALATGATPAAVTAGLHLPAAAPALSITSAVEPEFRLAGGF